MQWLTGLALSLPLVGVYAIFAIGIVLIYRASKVLNLAHGAMATLPAYVAYTLRQQGVPTAVAIVLAIASAAVFGWLVQRAFVRPFRKQGATAQTVGTVVVLGLTIAAMARIWGSSSLPEPVQVFPDGFVTVGLSSILYGEIGLFLTMLVLFVALRALFKFTDLGLLMRGSAENPRAASLMGVNPERMTALTWMLGGALAGVAGIQFAAVSALEPYNLPLQALPGFLAALIGGLENVSGAVVGGVVVGLLIGMVPFLPAIGSIQGSEQLLLAVLGLIVMARRGKQLADVSELSTGLTG